MLQIDPSYVLLGRVQWALMDELTNLIQKAKKQEKDAFGKIYEIFYRRIFRFCKFNTRSSEIAQDICQETFIKAWKSLPSFKERGGSLQAYIFKIARNLIIDAKRKKKEERLPKYQEIETNDNLDEKITREENASKVQKALDKLDDLEKQIIILHYFEDMTGREIAQIVGIKEGNLRVKTHRALKKLKEIIGDNEI